VAWGQLGSHWEDRDAGIGEAWRILAPGGRLVLVELWPIRECAGTPLTALGRLNGRLNLLASNIRHRMPQRLPVQRPAGR